MRKQIKYRVMGLTMILAVSAGGSVQSFAEAASKESQDAKQDSLPQGLEWLTPFDETVKLDVVVGWSADDSVKAGTTPETNSLVTIAKDYLNIELNFLWMVPDDQFEDRLALLLSSGELPDIVTVADDFYEFLDNDCLRDLTDAYEQCASEELKDVMTSLGDDLTKYCSKDGKLYGIPAALDPIEGVPGLYYRSDWLEAVGMEEPDSMEAVNEMLIKFAEYGVSINDGKNVTGIGTVSEVLNTNFALNAYFQGYGAYPNKWIMRDGMLVNGTVQDEMLDALNGLRDLYEHGALAPDFATWNFDQLSEKITNDQVGAVYGSYYVPAWPLNQNKDANPNAEWAEIDLASLGGKSKPCMEQTSLQFFNVVTKDAPDHAEEALVKLLNLTLAVQDHSMVDKRIFNGLDKAENGASVFYLPVFVYYPTPWERYREDVWTAYENKDRESLKNDKEKELYDAMEDWLTNGNQSKKRGTSWGLYESRLSEDMGIALGIKARESGCYEPDYFYGAVTKTQASAASTLSDMTTSFVIDYILGQKTENDWAGFKASWNALGGADWTKEVNEQYAEITGK